MSIHVDSIVSQLPSFNITDLAKIKQCAEILMNGSSAPEEIDRDDQALFDMVKHEMEMRGIKIGMSYHNFRQGQNFKSWKKGVKAFEEFMDDAFKDFVRTKVERNAMFRLLVKILMRDMKRRKLPLSIGVVANNLQYIQQSFDNEFPNYLESGLAHLVPQALLKKK